MVGVGVTVGVGEGVQVGVGKRVGVHVYVGVGVRVGVDVGVGVPRTMIVRVLRSLRLSATASKVYEVVTEGHTRLEPYVATAASFKYTYHAPRTSHVSVLHSP